MRRTICTVKPWVLQSYRSSLPEFINIVTAACQTLQRHLWSFIGPRLKGTLRRNTIWPKMYEDQDSVLFDYSKVHSWYRLAATNGHCGAQSRLGLFFEFGKGVAQSRVQARGGRRLKDQVQQSVIGRGSTSLCLAECLAEKNKRLRPLSLSLCNKW